MTLAAALILALAQDSVRDLVDRLGADSPAERDRAFQELLRLGHRAEEELERAAASPEADVRERAEKLLVPVRRSAPLREALGWLARHASDEGFWGARSHARRCGKCPEGEGQDAWNAGVTGLALQAFLAAGHGPRSEEYGRTVGAGLRWLVARQDAEGAFDLACPKPMYVQAIATLALVQAAAEGEEYRRAAGKGVAYLVAAQGRGQGWRYTARVAESDSLVTIFAGATLQAARAAGFEVEDRVFADARVWFVRCTESSYGVVGYQGLPGGRGVRAPNPEDWDTHNTLAAGAALLRLLWGEPEGEYAKQARWIVDRDQPYWTRRGVDFCCWYLHSVAVRHVHGGGPKWAEWEESLRKALAQGQRPKREGCIGGSVDPADQWSPEGGRVYATAMAALSLQAEARLRLLQPKR